VISHTPKYLAAGRSVLQSPREIWYVFTCNTDLLVECGYFSRLVLPVLY
jgi:hypothetical protein